MSYEKRVGQRMPAGDRKITWHLADGKPPKSNGRRRGSDGPEPAYLRNVSATGAAVVAPNDENLARGAQVRVEVESGAVFVGRVRRVVVTDDPDWAYYGIEFIDETPELREWLREMMEESRGDVIKETDWRSAL